ncbi:hypothetical protein ABPG75_001314 [Micractinium tetrahymenae]
MTPPPPPPPPPQRASDDEPEPMVSDGSTEQGRGQEPGQGHQGQQSGTAQGSPANAGAGGQAAGSSGDAVGTPGGQDGGSRGMVGGSAGASSPPSGSGASGSRHGEPAGYQRAELLGAADLDVAVRGSLDPGLGSEPRTVRLERPPRRAPPAAAAAADLPLDDCCEHRQALVQAMSLGGGQHLFLPEGVAPASISGEQVQRCRSLLALLNGMHSSVFLQGQAGAPLFYLYFDPTDTAIAFNRGAPGQAGEIWYNAACDPPEAQGQQQHATHWFLTACHELGHNFVRRHDSAFADAMGQIVMQYTPRFRAYLGLCYSPQACWGHSVSSFRN